MEKETGKIVQFRRSPPPEAPLRSGTLVAGKQRDPAGELRRELHGKEKAKQTAEAEEQRRLAAEQKALQQLRKKRQRRLELIMFLILVLIVVLVFVIDATIGKSEGLLTAVPMDGQKPCTGLEVML